MFIAAPIGTGQGGQFKSFDLAGRLDVGAGTKIGKLALLVKGDLCICRQVFNQLYLVNFALFFVKIDGFCARQGEFFDRQVCLDDLLHLSFDFFQIRV